MRSLAFGYLDGRIAVEFWYLVYNFGRETQLRLVVKLRLCIRVRRSLLVRVMLVDVRALYRRYIRRTRGAGLMVRHIGVLRLTRARATRFILSRMLRVWQMADALMFGNRVVTRLGAVRCRCLIALYMLWCRLACWQLLLCSWVLKLLPICAGARWLGGRLRACLLYLR